MPTPKLKNLIDRAHDAAGRAVFLMRLHGPEMARLVKAGMRIERFIEGAANPIEWLKLHAPDLLEDFAEGRIRLEQDANGRTRIVHDTRPERTPRRRQ
jgi:hypothetical protein